MLKFLGIWAAVMAIAALAIWSVMVTKGMIVIVLSFLFITGMFALLIYKKDS